MYPDKMEEHDQMSATLLDEGTIDACATTAAGSSVVTSQAQQSACALDESGDEGARGVEREENHAIGSLQVNAKAAEGVRRSVHETEHAKGEKAYMSHEGQLRLLREKLAALGIVDDSASRISGAGRSAQASDDSEKGAALSVTSEDNRALGSLQSDSEAVKKAHSSFRLKERDSEKGLSLSLEKQRSLFQKSVAQMGVSRHDENFASQGAQGGRTRADPFAVGFDNGGRNGDKGVVVPVDYAYGMPSDFDELPSHGFESRRRFHVKPASPSVPGEWRPVMHGKIKHGVASVEASSGALCWTTGGATRPDGKAWVAAEGLFPKSPPVT